MRSLTQPPPPFPSNLSATAVSSSQINLTWTDNATNEKGFNIERALSSSGPWSQIASVDSNVTTYQNTGLSAFTTFYYRVCSFNSAGTSSFSDVASATTFATIPAVPSGLSATAASSSQINLTWSDNSANETGFKIERALSSGGPWSWIATVGANIKSYSNTNLSASTTYYYRVCSYNSAGNSTYSNTANATTRLAAPSNLTATAISSSQINLTWQDNSNAETGFQIWQSIDMSPIFSQIATVGANVTSYSNTGLIPATTYSYVVIAYNNSGVSKGSNVATCNNQLQLLHP